MPQFKIINNPSEINFYSNWAVAPKFDSKNRVVEHEGRQYQLIEKKEQLFSTPKRISRVCLGVLVTIASLGIALFSEKIRQLFTKSKETIRFGIPFIAPTISTEPISLNNSLQKLPANPPQESIEEVDDQQQEKGIIYPNQVIDIEKKASKFFFKPEEEETVKKIRAVIDKEVHSRLTTHINIVELKKNVLEDKKFIALDSSSKILEHPDFDGWIMKGGGQHSGKSVPTGEGTTYGNQYENLMRVNMAHIMQKRIEKYRLDIVIPQKRLLPTGKGNKVPLHEKYYVFSQKIEILSFTDTCSALQKMDKEKQEAIAETISNFIILTGFMDAHFGNIRWNQKLEKIAIIDTEPLGFLISSQEKSTKTPLPPLLSNAKSVKECILIGLSRFKTEVNSKAVNLPLFLATIESKIQFVKENFSIIE
ncbi:MAG: hypothetical protein QRY74_00350 [Chlamydia sp.]